MNSAIASAIASHFRKGHGGEWASSISDNSSAPDFARDNGWENNVGAAVCVAQRINVAVFVPSYGESAFEQLFFPAAEPFLVTLTSAGKNRAFT